MKIKNKLQIFGLSVAIIPLLLLGAATYYLGQQSLIKEVLDNLDGVSSRLVVTMEDLAERDEVTVVTFSKESAVKRVFGSTAQNMLAARSAFSLPSTLEELKSIDPNLRTLLVLDLDGKVVASTDKKRVGEAHAGEDFFENGKVAPVGNSYFKNAAGDILLHLSAPVYDNGNVVGVVVDEHYPKIVLQLTGDTAGLGQTGEIILVKKVANGDAIFVVPARFDQNAALVKTIYHDDQHSALIRALKGAPGVFTDAVDYRGMPIFASSRYIDSLQLGVEVKIDRAEALTPLRTIALGIIIVILLTVLLVTVVTFFMSRLVAGPIVALTHITQEISMGQMDFKFDAVSTKDEVGDLYRSFERILVSLKLAMRETGKSTKAEPPGKA